MNALKTGLYARSLIILGEDPAALAALTDEYFQRYRPATPEERDQVDILVRSVWTLRRLAVAEAQVWTHEIDTTCQLNRNAPLGHAFTRCDVTLTRLQRAVNATQRNYRDALHEIERLQSLAPHPDPSPQPVEIAPATSATEFVPSASVPPPPSPSEAPLPFHRPGSNCFFTPAEPYVNKYKQCPFCFPESDEG